MILAVSTETATALGRLENVPMNFWLTLGLGVVAVVAIVLFVKRLAEVNKVIMVVVAAVFISMGGFSWIYERNEPTWATPAVSFLAGFFPTKGKVTAGQPPAPITAAQKRH